MSTTARISSSLVWQRWREWGEKPHGDRCLLLSKKEKTVLLTPDTASG